MSKVEMSLEEYNAMKSELDAHKEIVSKLFGNIQISDWSKEYYMKGEYSTLDVPTETNFNYLSPMAKAIVLSHVPATIEGLDGKFSMNDEFHLVLGYYKKDSEG